MKKALTSFILTLALLLASLQAFAATSGIVVDGIEVISDVMPETKNNRIMVPLRVVSENLGINVDWSNSIVTLTHKNKKVSLTTKSNIAVIDGLEVTLDTKPYLKDDRVFVPLRFIAETFNSNIEYSNHIVTINTTPLYINGVKVKTVQEEYHMTMGGVEQQIYGNANIQAIYNLIIENKGAQIEAPAEYSWESHPSIGSYNKSRQYNFLDVNGKSIYQYDLYHIVDSYEGDYKHMPQLLLHDAILDQWFLIKEDTFSSLWDLIITAHNNGFVKVISNTVP